MFNDFAGGQSLGSLQWSFSAWAKSGTPFTYSVCKALRSVPGCQWSFDHRIFLVSFPLTNGVFIDIFDKRLEHVGAKGQSVVYSNHVQWRCTGTAAWWIVCVSLQTFADVSEKKWWASKRYLVHPGATMEIRLSQSQMAKICWMPSVYLLHLQSAQIVLTSNVSSNEARKSYSKKPDSLLGQGCISCSWCIMIWHPIYNI